MDYIKYVNIDYGTNSDQRESKGNTLPNVQLPFGSQSFVLQTHGDNGNWFYKPDVSFIEGVRISNQPSPWLGDNCNILFLPYSGNINFDNFGKYTSITNKKISPAYIEMFLNKYRVEMKVSPSHYGGNVKLKYEKQAKFLIQSNNCEDEYFVKNNKVFCKIKSNHDLEMYKYYEFEFNCKINKHLEINEGKKTLSLELEEKNVELKISSSYISFEQVEVNMSREYNSYSESNINAINKWNNHLSTISFDGSEKEKKIFYSNLYRCFCFPRKISEVDKSNNNIYMNFKNKNIDSGLMYSDVGYWDIYRTSLVLLKKITPKVYKEIIDSIICFYKSYHWLPRWVSPYERGIMPSTLVDISLSDAILNGFVDKQDINIAIEALLKDANQISNDNHGRENMKYYLEYGYLPSDLTSHSVSSTLDYFYCDYAISKAILKYDEKSSKILYDRSQKYKTLLNKNTNLFEPIKSDGTFETYFNPNEWGTNYCESNAWQNNFNAPFAIFELISIIGKENVLERLNYIFENEMEYDIGIYNMEIHEMTEVIRNKKLNNFALSNQPSFILPFIYLLIGQDELFYEKIKIAHEYFEDGYPGDEDNGSLSAWYVLTCIGEYPIEVLSNHVSFKPKFTNLILKNIK